MNGPMLQQMMMMALSGGGLPVTSGLILDLDAKALSLSDGAILTAWADTSGAGNNATAIDSPTYRATGGVNGNPGVDFDPGSTSYVDCHYTMPIGTVGATMFIVAKNPTEPPTNSFKCGLHAVYPGSDDPAVVPFTNGFIYDGFCSTARQNFAYTGINMSHPFCYTARSAASYLDFRVNGSTLYTNTGSTFAFPSYLAFGFADGASIYSSAVISEALFYTRKLTDTEVGLVEAYLAAKWGAFG